MIITEIVSKRIYSTSSIVRIFLLTMISVFLGCSGNILSDSPSSQVMDDGGDLSSGVALDSLPIVNVSNAASYTISGDCLSDLGNVSITTFEPTINQNGFCVNDRYSVVFDLSLIISPTLSINVMQGPLSVDLINEPIVDLIIPTVTFSSPSDIGNGNEASYSVNGTCSEDGRDVFVSVGGLSPSSNPVCSGGVWSVTGLDATSLAEGGINLTADHKDVAGNNAVQAADTISKILIPDVLHAQATSSTSGANINTSPPGGDLQWTGLTVSPNFFSINPVNTDEINILQAGDYRLSLTLPMSSPVLRSNVAAIVKVNTIAVQGGYSASSYIRNISNHNNSSDHIDIILNDLNMGDIIEVQVQQEAALGTVSIVTPAQIFMEPIDSLQTYVATSNALVLGTNLNVNSSAVALEWTSLKTNASYSLNGSNPEDLTINDDGHYFISLNVPVSSTSIRSSIVSRITIDGTSVVGSSARQGYIRRDSGHDNASVHWYGLVQINAGEVLNVEVLKDASNGTVNFLTGQSARLSIEKIQTTDFINLRAQDVVSGTNWNQSSTVEWDIEDDKNATIFDHSILSSSDTITVLKDGDYFISYSDSLSSNVQRSAVIIDILINGNSSGLQCATHYIRSSSGHNKSSCSISGYLRSLKSGDTISIGTSVGGLGGNTTSNDDARLTIIRK